MGPELKTGRGGVGSEFDQNVRAELEKILAGKPFVRNRLSALLRFVVEHALERDGDSLKEHRLGVEVFGRSPSYDPRMDPVVRVQAPASIQA